jgi:hypothetical protein
VFDYYNFWTFGNFPLFWSRVIGKRYPEWDAKFRGRVKQFLNKTPYFFAADGAIPLYGRSLLYRWDVLSPLVLGYEMGSGLTRRGCSSASCGRTCNGGGTWARTTKSSASCAKRSRRAARRK